MTTRLSVRYRLIRLSHVGCPESVSVWLCTVRNRHSPKPARPTPFPILTS
ncbi:hypothetical protein B0G69_6848 [Paraburkholderia sp. RAU2J]|nr:hypothetical protein B0G69_6848 [Paraburkholderia sp. RAU2J]